MALDALPATGETRLALVRRARRTARELAVLHPDAHCELDFTTPLELAVATVLSAQCTDRRVNEVTPALFARYPTAADYAAADRAELEALIRPTGFFRNKADAACRGSAPRWSSGTAARCPAGSRTSSRCPASAARPPTSCSATRSACPGITVDTHLGRLVRRFGWTAERGPGQGRARRRRPRAAAGVDAVQPPDDLPRPPGLPRPQAGLRGLRPGPLVPVVRHRPDRPRGRRGARQGPGRAGVTRPRWAGLLAVLVLLAGALVVGLRDRAPQEDPAPGRRPRRRGAARLPARARPPTCPRVALPCFGGGPDVARAPRRPARPLLVNVWATWCPPCVDEVPALVAFADAAQGRVGVVGVVHQDSPASVYAFAQAFGVRYPLVRDDAGGVLRALRQRPAGDPARARGRHRRATCRTAPSTTSPRSRTPSPSTSGCGCDAAARRPARLAPAARPGPAARRAPSR